MRRLRPVSVAILVLLGVSGSMAQDRSDAAHEMMTIAEVRQAAAGRKAGEGGHVCIRGQVTLRPGDLPDDPGNFYIQDATGGISILAVKPERYNYGQWIVVRGRITSLSTDEPEVAASELVVAGPGRMPPPKRVSLADLARGRHDGQHVSIVGVVAKLSASDVRDDVVLQDGDQNAEAYARRLRGAPVVLPDVAPIGSWVEIRGVAMPSASATVSRVRMRGPHDLLLLERPAFIITRAGRIVAGAALLVVLLAAGWIWTLRRSVHAKTSEIRGLLARAEEASRLKSEFLANISHEIRTPLHGVIGLQEMALRESRDDGIRRYLELSNQASRHLLSLLNDVLDLAAVERGAIQVHLEPMSPAGVMRDAAGMFSATASAKSLTIEVEDLGLPSRVMCDRMRLTQVIANLVNNAVKFTSQGKVRVTGRAGREGSGWRLAFEISDTGIGISPADLKRIFEEFRQADGSIRRQYGGSGLGLALSARLVTLMGGSISVQSEPGIGSIFNFDVLCAPCPGADDSEASSGDTGAAGRQLRVLLVEDNHLNQMVAARLLERDGHSVDIAENGLAALAAFARSEYDAILMDIQMPGMDGISTAREIRNREPAGRRTPIVALTAHTGGEDHICCAEAGMDGFLSKPFNHDQLRDALCRVAAPRRPA
ncbi:MAG: response regulator [Bryobacteraceae bacterium]|nr:response regulator [Bryobacteraceae bacterium]